MIKFTRWVTLILLLGHRRKVEMLFRLSILVLAMVISGCATIIDGSSQPLTFNSSPNGARIYVNGMELGTTPLTMPVKRSKTTMILAKKNGYEDQQLVLQTKINSWFWGNILLGLYSSTTDYASDAMIEYSPNMYYITLNPVPLLQSNNGGFAVERGARTRIEQESHRTERQVRNFILRYHAYLTSDISRGQGEYLSSLYTMLQLPESSETLKRLRSIAARNQEAPSFAEALLNKFPVNNPGVPPQRNNGY
jgi:hypothetical protein